ncbi:class I SAM-dependent methyltransferase [Leifsonia poae]|uniref:class I SAM-dependent methyltransferase n=1 Tax=Leifsonia poae TaxID=110933 RepID=UPI003D668BD4
MTIDTVRDAYSARSAEYIDLFGTVDVAADADRQLIKVWSESLTGSVLDVGCGPGQWTDFLVRSGVDAEGLDIVPEFLDYARKRFPGVPYRCAGLPALGVPDASISGVLAWFSLIHLSPEETTAAYLELARVVQPGGTLLIGFFEGDDQVEFPHAVATATYRSVESISRDLATVGFRVRSSTSRVDPGVRPLATVTAERVG